MSAIKTVTDPQKGCYDVLVGTNIQVIGTIVVGSSAVVGGVVSASAGATTFVLSGAATTVKLPTIADANIGTSFRIMAETSSLTVSAANPITTPVAAWTASVLPYSSSNFVSVSGTLGYYWHVL